MQSCLKDHDLFIIKLQEVQDLQEQNIYGKNGHYSNVRL